MLDSLLGGDLRVTLDDTAYLLAARPTRVEQVAIPVVVLLFLVLCAFARRARSWVPVVVAAGVALFLGGGAAAASYPFGGTPHDVAQAFHAPLVTHMVAIGVGIGTSAGVLALAVGIGSAGLRRLGVPCLVALALAVGLTATARHHRTALLEVGDLPFFVVEGRDDLHAGREREVRVGLRRAPVRTWFFGWHEETGPQAIDPEVAGAWAPPPQVRVRAEKAERFPFVVEARRGPVRLATTLTLRGREERAHPLLPLRVGNRWVYREVTENDRGLIAYQRPIGGERREDRVELEVIESGERDGFRTFTVEARRGGASSRREVVAVEGQTRLGGPDGELAIDGAPDGRATISCKLGLLGCEGICQQGGAEVDEPAAPPPARKGRRAPRRAPRSGALSRSPGSPRAGPRIRARRARSSPPASSPPSASGR